MKSNKAQIHAKFHKIPKKRFENQQITSFSGLLIFQLLFKRINLKQQLKKCFGHLKVSRLFLRNFTSIMPSYGTNTKDVPHNISPRY